MYAIEITVELKKNNLDIYGCQAGFELEHYWKLALIKIYAEGLWVYVQFYTVFGPPSYYIQSSLGLLNFQGVIQAWLRLMVFMDGCCR